MGMAPLLGLEVVSPTRPFPLARRVTQAPSNRIVVNVLDRGLQGLDRGDVPIIAAALLPESEGFLVRTLPNRQALDKLGVGLEQVLFDPCGDRSLDGEQQPGDGRGHCDGKHDEMNMLRHVDESDQLKTLLGDRSVNGLGQ